MRVGRAGMFTAMIAAVAATGATVARASDPQPQDPVQTIVIGADRSLRMTVPVSVGGQGPYDFVVDTGAERTVIARELAARLGLAAGPTVRLNSITGTSNVPTVVIPTIGMGQTVEMGTSRNQSIEAPALLEADLGASGLLGIDSLQKQRVTIDFRDRTMTVQPSKTREQRIDPDTITVTARSRLGRLILTDAEVDGTRIQVILDTGSQTSIGNEALRRRFFKRNKRAVIYPVVLSGVTGGTIGGEMVAVDQMRIGGVTFNDLPIAFADIHTFKKLGLDRKPALILGMDALKLFDRVSVDFANRKVRFLPPGEAARDGSMLLALKD